MTKSQDFVVSRRGALNRAATVRQSADKGGDYSESPDEIDSAVTFFVTWRSILMDGLQRGSAYSNVELPTSKS